MEEQCSDAQSDMNGILNEPFSDPHTTTFKSGSYFGSFQSLLNSAVSGTLCGCDDLELAHGLSATVVDSVKEVGFEPVTVQDDDGYLADDGGLGDNEDSHVQDDDRNLGDEGDNVLQTPNG